MKMECTGAKDCGNTGCYHYEVHDDVPTGANASYCVGTCFNNSVCRKVAFQEAEKKSGLIPEPAFG